MDAFRVRLNCIDHYQANPTHYDPDLRCDIGHPQPQKEPQLPVVRVFGATETGQKVCAHIHGAFPYLYVEYSGSLAPDDVGVYIHSLHLSIDHALAVSYRRNAYGEDPKFVARITLAKGIPFYGFHVGYRFYLKIYMLNPMVMTRLAELLRQGVIMEQTFQPHEAHLQYLLQFMADYNLYGCGYIEARTARFRAPVPYCEQGVDRDLEPNLCLDSASPQWNSQTIPTAFITDSAESPRLSHCSIEVDICVQDILNRHDVKERRLHHDFIERLNPLPADIKLVNSMAGLWKDETRRRKRCMTNPAPGSSPFPPEVLISMSANFRHNHDSRWINEDEYREQIRDLILAEQERNNDARVEFDTFVKPNPFEPGINTLLQSVEDLYPENLAPAVRLPDVVGNGEHVMSSIFVDEQKIMDIQSNDDSLLGDISDKGARRKASLDPFEAEAPGEPSNESGSELDDNRLGCAPRKSNEEITGAVRSAQSASEPQNIEHSDTPVLFPGVYTSCLRTRQRSKIPISQELLWAAEQYDMLSKIPPSTGFHTRIQIELPVRKSASHELHSPHRKVSRPGLPNRIQIELPMKRTATAAQNEPSKKRTRVAAQLPMSKKQYLSPNATEISMVFRPPSQDQSRVSSQANSARSTQTSKKHSKATLSFPVVKYPNDIETRLRLSQQRCSQGSQDTAPSKSVRFESSLCATQDSPGVATKSTAKISVSSPATLGSEDPSLSIDIGCVARPGARFYVLSQPPPSVLNVASTMQVHNLPDVIYQDAYYSKDKDVPQNPREYAGREFRIESNTLPYLPEFDATGTSPATYGLKLEGSTVRATDDALYRPHRRKCSLRSWEFAEPPPTFQEVKAWREQEHCTSSGEGRAIKRKVVFKPCVSQIEGPTQKNKHGFKYTRKKKSTSVQFEAQYMSTMSLEIHVNTRGKLVPNPEEDEVQCIFWYARSDDNIAAADSDPSDMRSGIIMQSEDESIPSKIQQQVKMEVVHEASELDLMVRMVEIVRGLDPDILTGYEIHGSSWGYLVERARIKYDYSLCDEFSRMKSQSFGRFANKDSDKWGFNQTSTLRVTGRHVINVWRAMRSELNLLQYTLENVAWHLLHRRIPHYSWEMLTKWYTSGKPRELDNLLRYYLTRSKLDIEILDANELVARTSEQARLLGVDFFSVFSRGSQFKVESIMFRIAKPENFALVSPDRKQVGAQNALECLPLVMEPQSAFYNSPLLVLDFQSLYPSVMIAYNYCYSTFLGRIVNWRGGSKMGFTEYKRQERLLELLQDYINVAPNGIMYCKGEIRKSLLAKMLTEILETRVMVKSGMKQDKDDETLQQLLNNRQLALKLLANVTYGYASASFSGRMPCSEIADSIVQTGRETLEKAIALIHSVPRWKAEVVYGDTDSLFVYLPGRTKDQAFDIGNEIAETITDMNPRPMKLKFEKVYHPCVLLAKKRYVGYKYESRDQVDPVFDAKGIETVRRDGTRAEQMIEEKALRILFGTADLSHVKSYFQSQCNKIMRGAVSIQDFCFAREVKLGMYSEKGLPPPGAMISTKRMLEDARAEPQYGERVPYVVVSGAPGARLIDRCIAPEELLRNEHLTLDAEYYISKNLIPPLERIFNLVGANVRAWYDEMPKVQRIHRVGIARQVSGDGSGSGNGNEKGNRFLARKKKTMESYMKAAACLVCGAKVNNSSHHGPNNNEDDATICSVCRADAPASLLRLQGLLAREERRLLEVQALCRSCASLAPLDDVPCDSQDCPVFYTRVKQAVRCRNEKGLVEPVVKALLEGIERADLEW